MRSTSPAFKANARAALADAQLQRALSEVAPGLAARRSAARAGLPEFEALRERGRAIKDHTLAHLDLYLEEFERKATEAGSRVHFAPTAEDARQIIAAICREAGARIVTKGKSMISEEVGLNAHLEGAGLEVVETDLGEYLIQIRGETPSHIIAPAIHLTQDQVEADFRRLHKGLRKDRVLIEPTQLVAEARQILRDKFLSADVGITGANFLIAETGSSVIVTNEGNGDLTQSLPRVHIVLASIEKMVPTLEDADTLIRLLARSATGQEISTYTTFSTGPRRAGDPDGPEACHVVILDNGRSELLGTAFREVLRCIRCGACMNHCPVYTAIGGHAYGWVYPGPIGSVLTPALIGVHSAAHLPNASTFCGRCEEVCPMKIPLPGLMRHWREEEFSAGDTPLLYRLGLKAWASIARRPRVYHALVRTLMPVLGALGRRTGAFRHLPLARGWTKHRDLAAPQGRTFQALWADHKAGVPR
ncbi:MAG TPA: LutB/LldF family L-lactate oxidation iron-sulfur protein [Hyphomicrobiaceae bacterium]|nr:LutB/LldF family L-lactate oxidation iron-sulfur protein [Hyphomicrobiaceae bacterium]